MTNLTVRRRVRLLAVLALAMAPILSPVSAQAAELRLSDTTHDVVKVDYADADPEAVPDPDTTNADIRSAFIHYRKGRLVLRANFVDLRRAPDTLLDFTGVVRTNERRQWVYDVTTSPGRYAGHDMLMTPRGRRVCEIGHRFDYAEDFARVSIPLSCLSRPTWVQVKMAAATFTFAPGALESEDIEPGDLVLRLDDALSDTADFTRWTARVRRG